MVIGVTGLYAAGKDEATKILCERGFTEINVDRLGHRALAEKKNEIIAAFGKAVQGDDGSVDRQVLGALVFHDRNKLARLEAIVHPFMKELVERELIDRKRNFVINAALLFPMRLAALTDLVIVVRAPFLTRLFRARRRDRLGWRELLSRFRSQKKIIPQPPPENVDIYYVWNTRNRTYLKDQLSKIVRNRSRNEKKANRP